MTTQTDRDRAIEFFHQLTAGRPVMAEVLQRLGPIQIRMAGVCPGCGSHSLIECEPTCPTDAERRRSLDAMAPHCDECGQVDHRANCPTLRWKEIA